MTIRWIARYWGFVDESEVIEAVSHLRFGGRDRSGAGSGSRPGNAHTLGSRVQAAVRDKWVMGMPLQKH